MNYKSLSTLEYNKIIDKLVSFAASDLAKERLAKLVPMTSLSDINDALTQTNDALSRIYAKGSVAFSGIHDIRGCIKRLEVGSALNIIELLHISSLLTSAGTEPSSEFSRLQKLSAGLCNHFTFWQILSSCKS